MEWVIWGAVGGGRGGGGVEMGNRFLCGEVIEILSKPGRRRQREESGTDCLRISKVFATLFILILPQMSSVSAKVLLLHCLYNYGRATVVISQNDAHVLITT